MSVDVQPAGGRMVLHVGPVERALMVAIGMTVVAVVGWSWDKLNKMSESMSGMSLQLAVTNVRSDTLATQLADVPGLTKQIAEMRTQIDRNTRDIHDLDNRNDPEGRKK